MSSALERGTLQRGEASLGRSFWKESPEIAGTAAAPTRFHVLVHSIYDIISEQ
jgi:hypothetical protein